MTVTALSFEIRKTAVYDVNRQASSPSPRLVPYCMIFVDHSVLQKKLKCYSTALIGVA